ncbi:MAG: OmpA family protein, partial [Myxococcales bacterium]
MRGAWVTTLVLGALISASGSSAQDATLNGGGMDLHLFRPAIDTRGYFSVNGSEVMPHKEFSFGLVLDAGFSMLRYNGFINDPNAAADQAARQTRIARQGFTGTFMFNFGLIDRLVIGIQLPITFFRGHAVQTPDLGASCPTASPCLYNNEAGGLRSQGVGDLTIHAKARLLNLGESPVGIAVTLRVGFPTAKTTQFAGEPGVSLWPTAVFEFQPIEKIRLAVEGGYRWNSKQGATFIWDGLSNPSDPTDPMGTAVEPVDQGQGRRFTYNDLITFGFGASFRVARSLDLIAEFYGTQIAQEIGTKGTLSMEVLGGFKYFVTNKSFLYLAGGAGIPKTGFQAADARAVLGFMYEPAVEDRDGDGIPDDDDACPDDPEDKDGFEDSDGCPDLDNDGDGILDVDDACPLVKEDYDGDRDEDGCPEGREGDRDGD